MDSNSTSNKSDAVQYPTADRSRTWFFRSLHALCGRQSLSDLNILDEEATTRTDLNILDEEGSTATPYSSDEDEEGTTAAACSWNDFDRTQSYRYRYDVFISFRGVDTRDTFADHLYAHLTRKGIFTFKDDQQLQKGESISLQLRQAIQHSRLSIVVFSKDYAASTWCLDEMTVISECLTKLKQIVLPVFYYVDPSHVRKQNGMYQKAFVLHTETFKHFDPQKVDRWKRAMTCLAGLAGWDVTDKSEYKAIEIIVQAVIEKLGHKFSGSADDLIGIQTRVEELEFMLELSSDDDGCRVLGIWGMDGIGKTTLANVLYDTISHQYQFDACCFIEDVSKIYRDGGAIAVQKRILHQTIKEKNLEGYSPSEISGIITNRLYKLKLLLVLDNVDQSVQLQELHINPIALCAGSRIIITTRDKHILIEYEADIVYEAELLNDNDAHELLCRKAFKSDYPSSDCDHEELIPEVLKYAQGLPLAIRVMGSFLYKRNTAQWRAALEGWQNNPDSGIMKVLRSSFEGLELREKEIFLHVACFFDGEREDYVRRILHACGLQPNIGIPLLAEKSLITIRNQEIHMHEMLQELGKQIVREQHPDEPRLWSRLWLYSDFCHAMITQSEGIKAKAIILNQKEDVSKFNHYRDEDLSTMKNLKVLILYHTNFSGSPIFLSNSLYYLLWSGYPFMSLPSNFNPYQLVELNMPDSNIEQLWIGMQHLPNLKRMDLSNSKNLKMTPCFDGILNLERLDLTGCINLLHVDPSIGLLTELVFLSLQNCSSLVSLDFGNAAQLWSLKVLRLSDCTQLENTPDFSGLTFLQYLDMERCASLSTIHESIGALANLRFLSLKDCTNLVGIPDSFKKMASLRTLDLCRCSKFTELGCTSTSPLHLQSLIYLDLSFCSISIMPDAIGELMCLERLNLQGNNFTSIPSSLSWLHNLSYLNLSHCHKLWSLPSLPIPTESGPSDSVGRYFKTTSGSRDHRSGLYIFDSPNCMKSISLLGNIYFNYFPITWVLRLLKEPLLFRCGFDFVVPWHEETNGSDGKRAFCSDNISELFDYQFKGGSIVRINNSFMNADWLGFLFFVTFELKNHHVLSSSPHQSHSLPPLPHPFYLSFESEYTEERFDMSLDLERNTVDGKNYLWTIFISREHCHFVETGAQITFKARQGLIIKEWGLRVVTKIDIEGSKMRTSVHLPLQFIDNAEGSSSVNDNNFETKIQLPYNWLVSNEDSIENDRTKGKETDLFNLGLFTERPQ